MARLSDDEITERRRDADGRRDGVRMLRDGVRMLRDVEVDDFKGDGLG